MKKYSDGSTGYGSGTYGPRKVSWCPPAQPIATFAEQSALSPSWRDQAVTDSPFVETDDNTIGSIPCEDSE